MKSRCRKDAAFLWMLCGPQKIRVRAKGKDQRVRLCAHLNVNLDEIARTLDNVHTLAKA